MDQTLETRIGATTTAVIWLSTLAILLLIGFALFVTGFAVNDPIAFFARILPDFDFSQSRPTPTATDVAWWQGALVALLWSVPDFWGGYLFYRIRQLFVGIRRNGVFQPETAKGLRQVGWALVLLAAVVMIFEMLTALSLSYYAYGDQISGEVSLEDTQFYCIVIGLVILALGRVMVDATRLSEENRAFV